VMPAVLVDGSRGFWSLLILQALLNISVSTWGIFCFRPFAPDPPSMSTYLRDKEENESGPVVHTAKQLVALVWEKDKLLLSNRVGVRHRFRVADGIGFYIVEQRVLDRNFVLYRVSHLDRAVHRAQRVR
jgi:hypothetical protein